MPDNQNNGEIQQPPQENDGSSNNNPAPEDTEQQREQIKEMGRSRPRMQSTLSTVLI